MADETAKGVKPITSPNTPANALGFVIQTMINSAVNTALPVRVDAVEPGGVGPVGFVSVTPMVAQRDADNEILPMSTIHHVPYARLQGGVCAVIVDPEPGDIGIAVFAKRDISALTNGAGEPVQPGSYRSFDEADAMYIGGVLNKEPKTWIEMTQDGVVTIHAPQKIVLDTPLVEIDGKIVQTAGQGQSVTTKGGITNDGGIWNDGGIINRGGITNNGGQTASNGVVLETHVHGGVESGPSRTGVPI